MKILLDSGAYSAWRKKEEIDIEDYMQFMKQHSHHFENCFNLDVILDGKLSYYNWIYLRRHGFNVVPVYHIGTDEKWLQKYLKKTDYIGLGAIANVNAKRRYLSLDRIWEKYNLNRKDLKVHGMGVTDMRLVRRFNWYSVDSISALANAAYGGIFLPKIRQGKLAYDSLDAYTVTMQSRNASKSFYRLPKSLQDKYRQAFADFGIEIPNNVTERQNKEEDGSTLSNDWKVRLRWNLHTWDELSKSTNVNIFVGTTAAFPMIDETEGLGSLLSFYEKSTITKILKNYENKQAGLENGLVRGKARVSK